MRSVGLFAELNPVRPEIFQRSIRDSIQSDAGPSERALIEYLNSGIPLIDIMEATPDVISGDRYVSGGSSILTDGEWIWRRDLQYYVDRYHLALDEEFMNHVRRAEFRIVEPQRDRLIELARKVARDILDMA